MRNSVGVLIVGLMLTALGCGEGTQADGKEAAAGPLALEFSGDAKADGSPFSVFQGDIAVDERHDAWLPKRTAYHLWTVDAEEGSELFIDVASRDGDDTYMMLYREDAGGWSYVAGNDDCQSGTLNSCLDVTTEAGRHLVLVSTYSYIVTNRRLAATYEIEAFCTGGACADEPQMCGSRGLEPCPAGQYCDWPDDMCGWADGPGVCAPLPEACPEMIAEVCGCDGQTYWSACAAALEGVDTTHDGPCTPPGQGEGETCGGIAALQCQSGLKCDYSGTSACNIADVAGVCVTDEPTFCTTQYDPVCGCDGVTYGNDCMRIGAGVSFDHTGACN